MMGFVAALDVFIEINNKAHAIVPIRPVNIAVVPTSGKSGD